MSNTREVLAQLLSESQADVLVRGTADIWASVTSALAAIVGSAPGIQELDGRIVMPDELEDEFSDGHLVTPLGITTDHDQSATAYLVINTAIAAMFLDSQADDPGDQEQQTMVMASAVVGQVVSAVNTAVFEDSPNGLVVAVDDMTANSMPMLLATMEEPGLLLAGTVQGDRILPLQLFLPGTFLDILSVSFAEKTDAADEGVPSPESGADAGPSAAAAELPEGTPFTLSLEDLENAEVVIEPEASDAPMMPPTGPEAPNAEPAESEAVAPETTLREPTPISQSAVHRATFTPFGAPPESDHRNRLDLLAGLDMRVTVELGRADMTVTEVLGVGPGSVIELDRLAGEPVDILVNDRLIAHGEVVVVDENFGVRVIEIVKPHTDAGRTG